jgi:CBS-domain-containing membrane protein
MRQYLQAYFAKMRGGGNPSPHALNWRNALCSWLGSFLGIAAIAYLNSYSDLTQHDHFFLIGSFGATAVLLFGAPSAPFAQPSHVLGGHLVGATIGVTLYQFLPEPLWLSTALTVSLTTLSMYLTRTLHPPGGGTALIAIIGSEKVHQLGYWYVLDPVLVGVSILILMALVINNLSPLRKYPNYW